MTIAKMTVTVWTAYMTIAKMTVTVWTAPLDRLNLQKLV